MQVFNFFRDSNLVLSKCSEADALNYIHNNHCFSYDHAVKFEGYRLEPTRPELTQADLDGFHGSEDYFRHRLTGYLYTEGIKYMAEVGGAYWLIDEVMLANKFRSEVRCQEFQVWKLVRDAEGHSAWLTVDDGNDNLISQKRIPFTDFPLSDVRLFFENKVLYLPSER